jgi:tellurite resistance protein TehA-like permease
MVSLAFTFGMVRIAVEALNTGRSLDVLVLDAVAIFAWTVIAFRDGVVEAA